MQARAGPVLATPLLHLKRSVGHAAASHPTAHRVALTLKLHARNECCGKATTTDQLISCYANIALSELEG